ncbi:MAG: pyroglutamyl-peptidase I [Polaromonas sp.]|uniref:pyroglutamyl-peptidase I n=1 Tax=Polaromonas sp. TaxID=1869339 RepID=UPI002736556E|nr:pyroglutamyl-peptidase I [Polaromonas sp.]MDP2816880.1 pyroglutamyl-peptidase I [Polaromonas sp.]
MSTPTATTSPPTVLLTGFDPFGGDSLNPSWLAVETLQGRRIAGHKVVAAQLPTVFGSSLVELARLLREHRPTLVICVGQAGGRAAISLERIAINVNDARIADNAAAQPVDTPVVAGGPAAYFTTLPIKAMLLALQGEGIPAEVSQTAGTFVCNHVFYGLMHHLSTRRGFKRTRGGFVHVPWLPEQGQPSMTTDELVRGLRLLIATALATPEDIAQGAGAIS